MQILLMVALAAVQILSTTARLTKSDPVLVTAVHDGESITVQSIGRVRLLGIDAPAIGRGVDPSAPFAREARERLAGLVLNRWISLEFEGPVHDRANRHLAYVITGDGQLVNAVLLRDGFARVAGPASLTRLAELKRAEGEAQTARRGVWGPPPAIAPTSYTRPAGATRSSAPKTSKPTQGKKKKKQP